MGLSLDTSRDPLVLQVFAGRFGYAEVEAHFDELETYCFREAAARPDWRPAVFADMRRAGPLDARGRRRISQCFERLGPVIGRRVVAHGVVLSGKLGSGVLTAILWVQRPPWPIQAFSSADDANRWILRRFEEEGLPVPSPPLGWWERGRSAPRPGSLSR